MEVAEETGLGSAALRRQVFAIPEHFASPASVDSVQFLDALRFAS
jgi:hypothetical protein